MDYIIILLIMEYDDIQITPIRQLFYEASLDLVLKCGRFGLAA